MRCWDTGASLSGFEHQWQGRPWTSDLISLIYKGAEDVNSSHSVARHVTGDHNSETSAWYTVNALSVLIKWPICHSPVPEIILCSFLRHCLCYFLLAYGVPACWNVTQPSGTLQMLPSPPCSPWPPPPSAWFRWHFSVCSGSICLTWLYWGHVSLLIISPEFFCFVYVSLLLWT